MKNKSILILITLTTIIVIVSIIYTTFPRLQLNGSKNMVISYREKYEEPGVIIKNANSNYLSKIKIESNIDTTIIGNYYVDYSLKIGYRNLQLRRNIRVIDDIAPVIKLKGNQIVELSIREEYEESGYIATDEYDGDLTDKVEIIGEVNNEEYGEYVIKYRVKDNSNNVVEVNRIVKVIDEIAPIFECSSSYSAISIGSDNIIGCKAIDNFDGDITDKIKSKGNYDINKAGIYNVEYSVEDDAGNNTKIDHKIMVYEKLENPIVYLTFNNNESDLIEKVLEVLKEKEVSATFFEFINANNIKYLREISDAGHEIAIYGNEKTNITLFKSNFEKLEKLIYNETNQKITTFRIYKENEYDYNLLAKIKDYLEEKNISYYNYNIELIDSNSREEIEKNLVEQLLKNKEEEIIISINIDENETTIETLSSIIEVLKEMNYTFSTIKKKSGN